ncbi:MAG: Uma2 family endonuclease [Bryobacteraceae bacterium]
MRIEYPYALGLYSRFRADVAVVDPKRHRANRKRLEGAPEIVIKVMSRSNTEKKMDTLQDRCFENGCQSFWRVYPRARRVAVGVGSPAGITEYGMGDVIQFEVFGIHASIPVDSIFESLT